MRGTCVGGADSTIGARAADELGDALVVGPGSPYRDAEAVLNVIASARARGVPLLGT
jgi:CTP synthase (UTP-ammonia lyase)